MTISKEIRAVNIKNLQKSANFPHHFRFPTIFTHKIYISRQFLPKNLYFPPIFTHKFIFPANFLPNFFISRQFLHKILNFLPFFSANCLCSYSRRCSPPATPLLRKAPSVSATPPPLAPPSPGPPFPLGQPPLAVRAGRRGSSPKDSPHLDIVTRFLPLLSSCEDTEQAYAFVQKKLHCVKSVWPRSSERQLFRFRNFLVKRPSG